MKNVPWTPSWFQAAVIGLDLGHAAFLGPRGLANISTKVAPLEMIGGKSSNTLDAVEGHAMHGKSYLEYHERKKFFQGFTEKSPFSLKRLLKLGKRLYSVVSRGQKGPKICSLASSVRHSKLAGTYLS